MIPNGNMSEDVTRFSNECSRAGMLRRLLRYLWQPEGLPWFPPELCQSGNSYGAATRAVSSTQCAPQPAPSTPFRHILQ